MKIKFRFLSSLSFILIAATMTDSLMTPAASAYSVDDLNRLIATGSCPGCDLSGIDARIENLLDLQDANLDGAKIRTGTIRGANFNRANLRNATLLSSGIYSSSFNSADLTNIKLDIPSGLLSSNEFISTKLAGAKINISVCMHSKFSNVDMTEATVTTTTVWRYCNIHGGTAERSRWFTRFISQEMRYLNLRGAAFYLHASNQVAFFGSDLRNAYLRWDQGLANTRVTFPSSRLGNAIVNGALCSPNSVNNCTPQS